jgi:tricarballylate dehydrogenase
MYDLIVIGHGAAGLSAALAAAESVPGAKIVVLEQLPKELRGGNTRWSPANTRMKSLDELPAGFEEDLFASTGGKGDREYFSRLAKEAPSVMRWLESQGVRFESFNYLLSAEHTRIHPIGGGAAAVEAMSRRAQELGIVLQYRARAVRLLLDHSPGIHRIELSDGRYFDGRTVVLASGGFEGNPAMLREHFGPGGESLKPISPGSATNVGDGIRMAVEAGAQTSGDWSGMHSEPIDPRSEKAAALLLIYPLGIVVDSLGRRFFDEGQGPVHETWEKFSRAIHFDTPNRKAWIVGDSKLLRSAEAGNGIRTEVPPAQASTLEELADLVGIERESFIHTVASYNRACPGDTSKFDPGRQDGLRTAGDLVPPKSNWARSLDVAPFVAFPVIGAIVYTFGGLSTDPNTKVLSQDGPIERLFAAGEVTGHFYGTAPNSVAVMRSLVFGRVAGQKAAEHFALNH